MKLIVISEWEKLCRTINERGLTAQTIIQTIKESAQGAIVLKHDVETAPKKAFLLAKIEHQYGIKGTYYFQAYLLNKTATLRMMRDMQKMGHEISYHHDVMDANKGDIKKATNDFSNKVAIFREQGFETLTVCQHGNPIVKREGYTSNRDFFRNEEVRRQFFPICDVMVNYPDAIKRSYVYFSDAGYIWKKLHDPINDDLVKAPEFDMQYADLELVLDECLKSPLSIISTHPHRYSHNVVTGFFSSIIRRSIRFTAKLLARIPFVRRFFERHYDLAKKI